MTETATPTEADKKKWTCSGCTKEVEGGERAPRGWRGVPGQEGQLLCPSCNTGKFVVRAVAFPVAGPVAVEKVRGGPEVPEGFCTWEGLRSQLRPAFEESTRLVNWVVQQLRSADVAFLGRGQKTPAFPKLDLYNLSAPIAPSLAPQARNTTLRAASDRYSALRREILAGQVSLPSFRFPHPLPIQNQSWEPVMLPDGRPAVKVRIGAYYWTLRLRGGPMFRRQLDGLRAMITNEARRGDLVFYEKRAHGGDHRPSGALGPTNRTGKSRLMIKLVGSFPRREDKGPRQGILTATTKRDVLLSWEIEGGMTGRADGRYHPEHVRSWVGGHKARLQKWSDTLKPEHRFPAEERRRMVSDHEATLEKHRNRMKSFVQTTAAMLANLADRRRVAKVVYDDTDKTYCDLPWYEIRERLRTLLGERGIVVEFSADREEVK